MACSFKVYTCTKLINTINPELVGSQGIEGKDLLILYHGEKWEDNLICVFHTSTIHYSNDI